MADLYQFLVDHQIEYKRHDHPPVYTVADVQRLVPDLPAVKTKNLFLRDKKGRRHFLVAVPAHKRVNIKALGAAIGSGHLSFGSPDRLKNYLGVDPGSVTVLAAINDPDAAVELYFDRDLWEEKVFQFHPLVNTSTLLISREDLSRFFELTGHEVKFIDVPSQEQ
ncbi:MAG: prolyl-tRNA synthetase associated domain-containing protein [Desulfobacterales bacterium]